MPEINSDISIRIRILNPQRKPLGGTVDIEFKPHDVGQTVNVKGADASKDIDVSGLQRTPQGLYQVTVTPTDVFKPTSQFVTVPASGFNTVDFIIDKGTGPENGPPNPVQYNIQGNLTFDHGLPAAGITVRLYGVGFGGNDAKLGEVKTDAQGKYSVPYSPAKGSLPSIQVRVLDPSNTEVTISNTKFNAQPLETLNLVVPATVQPLAPEFQRLATDMQKAVGGVANLGQAQEGTARKDLTLLNQSTNWDARLVALAATAAQQSITTALGQDVLYSLFRIGLPTDPSLLAMVPSDAVKKALAKASQAGIVSMTDQQIADATTGFQNFATKARLAITTPGGVSSFNDLLSENISDATQRAAFANLYFSNPSAADFWTQAANLKIPSETLNVLKLQGKFLYLTFNNGALAQSLQKEIGSLDNASQLTDKDYHKPEIWKKTLTALAGGGGEQALAALIPPAYRGKTTAVRLAAYAGDLARRVRTSFPTQTVARMVETKELSVSEQAARKLPNFLRAAAKIGYSLGRTPLNTFLATANGNLPELDDASKQSLKTLHRLYQATPSNESLQAALKLGFTSAHDIASYSKGEFLAKYGYAFPKGEAHLVYGQSQTISSVTFNFYSMAKALDTTAPVYTLSAPASDRQNAKDALVKQFPSMASLFGNLDFCCCEACRSVLSPAAYFVDLLDMLGNHSAANAAGYTPLDVLLGYNGAAPPPPLFGRRPDLGALPLTCENTNTALPYIDLVNEILEYYIAHNQLDTGLAFDTGTTTTPDLTAEPQNILPDVYTKTLKQAIYPLELPFDLWIETVRGFLGYFKLSLAQVLDALRPADTLELFTNNPPTAYYRAGILAESLGLSQAEYAVFTATDTTQWYKLYGNYPDEPTALAELKNAKTLSQKLGVSYQGLVDLVQTGFFNPGLYPLLFQFTRFGIDMGTAFSFTGQPGYPALTPQQTADFKNLLAAITKQYKDVNPASNFDAEAWLKNILPANYSTTVLVLADPDTGCNFSGTTLQYADGTAAKPLDFLKLNLLVRLCNQLGCPLNDLPPAPPGITTTPAVSPWTLDEIDSALQAFFPTQNLPAFAAAGFTKAFGDSWKTGLVYLAHLDDLNTQLSPALGRIALLPLWAVLPVQGKNPLYAQLFLTSSVLNNDFAFDDPNGVFPTSAGDLPAPQRALSAHAAALQGVLGFSASDLAAILADAAVADPPAFSLQNISLCYRYSLLAQTLQLSVPDMIALKALSNLNPFKPLTGQPLAVLADDILLNQNLAFLKQAGVVANSGFTVEDLRFLLRHQYDPVGKYARDPNAQMALVQAVAGGVRQIQAQNTLPPDPSTLPESLLEQTVSGLFPAAILKQLFTNFTNAQTYTATANSAASLTAADFAAAPEISLSYDNVTNTQTLQCKGLLTNGRKAEIQALNTQAALNGLLAGLLTGVQQQAQGALATSISNILGVWASLARYEAVATNIAPAQAIADPLGKLAQADPALSFAYDGADSLQWLGYRGALTPAKLATLTGINASATLAGLLVNIQQQSLPAYSEMTGSLIALWCNGQSYKATQGGVIAANQIDPVAFAAALAQAQQNGTITGPVPAIQISYDGNEQTLACTGVLPDALRAKLAALIAAPPAAAANLAALLQSVRQQAVQQFQFLSTGLLDPALNDPDAYLTPYPGADRLLQQKFAKAELAKVFLPLLAQKLSRQLVLQTLSSTLQAEPVLLEALATDAALLNDPSNPGKSLLQVFLAVGQPGASAYYYDKNNVLLTNGMAATADTADATNNVPGAVRCHYEGFLQVPTDGPYRFFAALGNKGAQAVFHLDSPDPNVLFTNPIIQATAGKDGDESSQFVQLKAGIAYHFTLDFFTLGAAGARLLAEGETLPKGALSQILLYAQQAVDGFARAQILLAKALQILSTTSIGVREISYFVATAGQFGNLKLSSLPTQAGDDTLQKAQALFVQFLTLADYADLRKGPAGGSDGLIDVFQAAATSSGLQASYYKSADETGTPQGAGIAATADTTDPTNNVAGTASCRFDGYFLAPADGNYDFFAELGQAGAQVILRIDSPRGIAPLANPIVLQHTAAANNEETHQAIPLRSLVAYHLTLDFQSLGGGNSSLLVQGATLPKGPLSNLILYPVSQLPPWLMLANLTRRVPQIVKDVAATLGPDPHFSNNVGIRRMWEALQFVQLLGLPVQAVAAASAIATLAPAYPDVIAANFKNAVKAQYSPDQWRPIAQSVFDPLRRKKRDALVPYLVNALQLENSNQLFEYFLVDPGMEPVVQTSRIRLALSSIQTFIQRCFLNLENSNANAARNVAASAIPADFWYWMKRYRVWQANREIFLFPENWMEPEFRLDKTDLFQNLEGALLQGDVTPDLVEDAFNDYLKGLDLRARLDIVASYLDQDRSDPGDDTLYVLGRTYLPPYKYFFRTYAQGLWSGWEAVPLDIVGDHMVLLVWRGRLNLFWVNFIPQVQGPTKGSTDTNAAGGLGFNVLVQDIFSAQAKHQVRLQLHWSEYVKGKWTNAISTDPNAGNLLDVSDYYLNGNEFQPDRDVYIHVDKEMDAQGNEGAARILLDLQGIDTFLGFRVTNKNCAPGFGEQYAEFAPEMVYKDSSVSGLKTDATRFGGTQSLQAGFLTSIAQDGSGTPETEQILDSINNFELLTCANPVIPAFLLPPFAPAGEPDLQEAGSLVSPFFFKDTSDPNFAAQSAFQDERTFFVQPSLTETVVGEWQGWAIPAVHDNQYALDPNLLDKVHVVAQVPPPPIPLPPGDPDYSIFQMKNLNDWVTTPGVAVQFGGVEIGKTGGLAPAAASKAMAVAAGAGVITTVGGPARAAGVG